MTLTTRDIPGTPYAYEAAQEGTLNALANRVMQLRQSVALTPAALHAIRRHFRIKNIYHSNAIEGNLLNVGELGLTITGKPLRDQAEARNLGVATDFLEDPAANPTTPIREHDIRQIHGFVLKAS